MSGIDERGDEVSNDFGDLGIVSIFLDGANDRGADDDAVSEIGDGGRLFGGGDSKTNANRGVGEFAQRSDLAADLIGGSGVPAGHPGARKGIDESLGGLSECRLPVGRSGGGDEVDVVEFVIVEEFGVGFGFGRREVEKENAISSSGGGIVVKLLESVSVDGIEVSEEDEGCLVRGAEGADEVEEATGAHPSPEGAFGGHLVDDAIRHRVGKRDSEFDDVSPSVGEGVKDFKRAVEVGVSSCDVGDEGFLIFGTESGEGGIDAVSHGQRKVGLESRVRQANPVGERTKQCEPEL